MPSQDTATTNTETTEAAPENAQRASARSWRVALLMAAGIPLGFALGLGAGYYSARVPSYSVLTRLTNTPPAYTGARQTDLLPPVAGPPRERLLEMDRVIAKAKSGDAEVLPFLTARASLLLFEAHSPMAALADLDRVLALPQSDEAPEATYLKSRALFESGAQSRALSESHKLFKLFPRSWRTAELLSSASDVLEASGRISEAIALIEEVLPLDPRRGNRTHLDTGRRGRYPPRMEPVLLSLGRMYLRSGDLISAEAAFALVCRPLLGPDDFGETFNISPHMDEAEVGWCEAALRQKDPRAPTIRARLERLAEQSSGAPRRRARLVLGGPEMSPSERALTLVEARQLSEAAYEVSSSSLVPEHAAVALQIASRLAYADPHGALAITQSVGPEGLSTRGREHFALTRSRALESLGRLKEAAAALRAYRSERLTMAIADFARRHEGIVDADELRRAASHGTEFSRLITDRESGR